jgi:hypothetical protein
MSDDRPDVVPYVLTDLDDVDGTPSEGAGLTYTDGVWTPTPQRVPLSFMEDFTLNGMESYFGFAGTGRPFGLKRDTDLPAETPEPTDVEIAAGTITNYGLGKNVVRVLNDGVYTVSYGWNATAADDDDGRWITANFYIALNDENNGPFYWNVNYTNMLTASSRRQMGSAGSVTAWLAAGSELCGFGVYLGATANASALDFHGQIVRLG